MAAHVVRRSPTDRAGEHLWLLLIAVGGATTHRRRRRRCPSEIGRRAGTVLVVPVHSVGGRLPSVITHPSACAVHRTHRFRSLWICCGFVVRLVVQKICNRSNVWGLGFFLRRTLWLFKNYYHVGYYTNNNRTSRTTATTISLYWWTTYVAESRVNI